MTKSWVQYVNLVLDDLKRPFYSCPFEEEGTVVLDRFPNPRSILFPIKDRNVHASIEIPTGTDVKFPESGMLFSLDNLVRQERGLYTFATKYLKPEDRDSPEVCVRHKDYSSEEAKDFSMCWIDIEETMRLAESFLDVNFLTKRPTKISDVFRIIQAVYSRFNKDYLGVQGQNNGTPLDMLRKFERGEQVEGDCKDFVPVTQYILAAASVEHRDATGIINVFRDSVPHTWLEIGVQKEKTQLWVPYDYHWIPYVTQNWSAYSYLLQEELPHTQERVTCKIKLWE